MGINFVLKCRRQKSIVKLDDAESSLSKRRWRGCNYPHELYHRILKLACKIADLAGEENIQSTHLAEALQYRFKGMMVQEILSPAR